MIKDWLPLNNMSELFINKGKIDNEKLIEYAYGIFKNELMNEQNPIIFNNKKVIVNSPIFKCNEKFVKKGKNCNNTIFNCENCYYLNKEEMFFHITSNRDENIIKNLKSKYRNSRKSRVPGLFSYDRLNHIRWIRKIINEYTSNNNSDILYFEDIVENEEFYKRNNENMPKEKAIYFYIKECQFIVIIGQNLWDKKQNDYYLKSAYIVNTDGDEHKFERLYLKYKKRQEKQSGVS